MGMFNIINRITPLYYTFAGTRDYKRTTSDPSLLILTTKCDECTVAQKLEILSSIEIKIISYLLVNVDRIL